MSEVDARVRGFLEAASKARDSFAAATENCTAVAEKLEALTEYVQQIHERSQVEIDRHREARTTAERQKERFRYALWVYLQERDGVLGIHAPSHDTLNRIRELLEGE